ncbi:MAG: hypothetical protein GY780_07475 [bacterium]|nr:hypothetical protein [bacterium]
MFVYRDDNWVVVNKPEGMATHAGQPGELGVVEWLQLHHNLKTHVVSRLDRGTSGVLLLALNPKASAQAQDIHESGTALKTYEFISTETSTQQSWSCDQILDNKTARTEFKFLRNLGKIETNSGLKAVSLYEAKIERGRKHQIRRHAAASGTPILGDSRYGTQKFDRLCLHCRSLYWPVISPVIESPTPSSFESIEKNDLSFSGLGFALCQDRRLDWLPTICNTFRAVHRDEISGLPAAIDVYGKYFDAIWFDEDSDDTEIDKKLVPVLEKVCLFHGCRGGILRTHRRNPHQRQLVSETRIFGEVPPDFFTVREHGLSYEISLTKTQHTGLFLDQRDTRRRLFLAAENLRLANLFSYTCSFSVAAISAGGEVAFSVDLSKPGLNTGKKNFELNNLTEEGRGKFVQTDVRTWLDRQLRRKEDKPKEWQPLDFVVCDPPVFASSKKGGRFSVEKEWPRLAEASFQLLSENGQALFANNHRNGNHAAYHRELASRFSEVQDLRPPLDFPVAEGRPHHVRIFWCRK